MPENTNSYQITEEDANLAFPDLAAKLGFESSVLSGINSGMSATPPKGAMILTGAQWPQVGPEFPQVGGQFPQVMGPKPAGPVNWGKLNQPVTAGPRPKPATLQPKPATVDYQGQKQLSALRGDTPKGAKQERISTYQAANEQLRQKNNFNAQVNFAARALTNANDAFERNYKATGVEDFSLLPPIIGIDVANRAGLTPDMMAKRGFWFDETKGGYVNPGGKKDAAGQWIESPTNTQEHTPGQLFANQYKKRGVIYEWNYKTGGGVQRWKKKANGKYRLEMGNWGGQADRRAINRANRRSQDYEPTDNGSPVTVLNLKLGSG